MFDSCSLKRRARRRTQTATTTTTLSWTSPATTTTTTQAGAGAAASLVTAPSTRAGRANARTGVPLQRVLRVLQVEEEELDDGTVESIG